MSSEPERSIRVRRGSVRERVGERAAGERDAEGALQELHKQGLPRLRGGALLRERRTEERRDRLHHRLRHVRVHFGVSVLSRRGHLHMCDATPVQVRREFRNLA